MNTGIHALGFHHKFKGLPALHGAVLSRNPPADAPCPKLSSTYSGGNMATDHESLIIRNVHLTPHTTDPTELYDVFCVRGKISLIRKSSEARVSNETTESRQRPRRTLAFVCPE